MAFTPGVGQRLYTSLLGMARQMGSAFDPIAAAQRAYARRGPLTNSFLDFLNTSRSAGRAAEAGRSLRGMGDDSLRTRQHPIDPTLAGSADRFRYRVVVRDGVPNSPNYYETLITVDSPTPMSENEVMDRALQIAEAQIAAKTESPRAKTLQPPSNLVAVIVSAGRRN